MTIIGYIGMRIKICDKFLYSQMFEQRESNYNQNSLRITEICSM